MQLKGAEGQPIWGTHQIYPELLGYSPLVWFVVAHQKCPGTSPVLATLEYFYLEEVELPEESRGLRVFRHGTRHTTKEVEGRQKPRVYLDVPKCRIQEGGNGENCLPFVFSL